MWRVVRDELCPVIHKAMNASNPDAVVACCDALRSACAAVEKQLPSTPQYACGQQFSLIDCLAAPHILRLDSLLPPCRPEVLRHLRAPSFAAYLAAHHPRFSAWLSALRTRPSVASTYHHTAVLEVKRRAVAAWQGPPMEDSREGAKAVLNSLLQTHLGRGAKKDEGDDSSGLRFKAGECVMFNAAGEAYAEKKPRGDSWLRPGEVGKVTRSWFHSAAEDENTAEEVVEVTCPRGKNWVYWARNLCATTACHT